MNEELLAQVGAPGGSIEDKIESVHDVFRTSARHLESLQQVLRRRALENRQKSGSKRLPDEVEEVISSGTYLDSFLEAFDGQTFLLHREEIVPSHEYRLALEVHSGGAYWKSIPVQEGEAVRHKVETVGASSPAEGSANIISQFGAAQRGAVFVWRWQHVLDAGPYNLPDWLEKALGAEGNDPLRKLQGELEAIRRWEQQVQQQTCHHLKNSTEIKDVYIREVLRLWPAETDHQGFEQAKKCAWVEGLDANLFTGRTVLVHRVLYDSSHTLELTASIARRQVDELEKEKSPPYRLTTSWRWMREPRQNAAASSASAPSDLRTPSRPSTAQNILSPSPATSVATPASASVVAGQAGPCTNYELKRPGTSSGVPVSRPAAAAGYSELVRPGTAGALPVSAAGYNELVRPGTTGALPTTAAGQSELVRPGTAGAVPASAAGYSELIRPGSSGAVHGRPMQPVTMMTPAKPAQYSYAGPVQMTTSPVPQPHASQLSPGNPTYYQYTASRG
eukprot:TRINITY_DN106306_c0_g1_i1.p1 TRINITY_DN106306_c0_g1~~TRINITY_DN106306_c0_g1_i1.p1  ORF type:complete len:561 (-),score=107.18 TRINITY_DN106306_c0_g1_i1:93-1610(-)